MFIRFSRLIILISCTLLITACEEDLFPSNDQLSNDSVGTVVEDFTFTLSNNTTDSLSSRLQNADAVVLYFTMWCPVCETHMDNLRKNFKGQYGEIDFIFVDYVSGSIIETESAQNAKGYTDFDVIADYDNALQDSLSGTMGSTIVIDQNFIIQMDEDFKAGNELKAVIDSL